MFWTFLMLAEAPAAPIEPLLIAPKQQAQATLILPRNTLVPLALNDAINGKEAHEGDMFDLSVTQDVMLNGMVVIPQGSLARGEVTWATKKGMFGKSGKLTVELRYVLIGTRRIGLSGSFRQEGEGNTVATVGTVVAAGPFGALVTGRSAYIPRGREFQGHTTEDLPLSIDSPSSPR